MIELHPIFKLREKATEQIIELLDSAVLGTNGAHYRHLDTKERVLEADNPLFLSMERNDRVLGNITFCRRESDWYIRYFAVDKMMQSSGKKRTKANKDNLLRSELEKFFNGVLNEQQDNKQVDSFYAYIDPQNEKSLWMSENFGFKTVAKIATQTFSRVNPKDTGRVEQINDWEEVQSVVKEHFNDYNYFYTIQTSKPPFFVIKSDSGEIIAMAKTTVAKWEIQRLPGKFGDILVKMIPWIPVIRKLVRPKNHSFVVPEAVIVKNNDPKIFTELFEGILHHHGLNLIIWWVDTHEPLYVGVRNNINWGVLNKIIGVPNANVVRRSEDNNDKFDVSKPVYTIGFDFI